MPSAGRPSTSSLNSFASWCFELSSGLSEIASLLSSSACGFGLLKTASNATKNRPGLLPRNHPDLEEFGSSGFLLIEKRLNLVSGPPAPRSFFLFNLMFALLEERSALISSSAMCINHSFR